MQVSDQEIKNLKELCGKAKDSFIADLEDAGLGVEPEKISLFKQCVNTHITKLEELHDGGLPNRKYAKEELHNYLMVLNSIITTKGSNYILNHKDLICRAKTEDEKKQTGRDIINGILHEMKDSLELATVADKQRRENLGFLAKEKKRVTQTMVPEF